MLVQPCCGAVGGASWGDHSWLDVAHLKKKVLQFLIRVSSFTASRDGWQELPWEGSLRIDVLWFHQTLLISPH